jgi:hypothetical protein
VSSNIDFGLFHADSHQFEDVHEMEEYTKKTEIVYEKAGK